MITYVQVLLVLYILWDIFHLFSGGAKVVGSHASGIFGKLFKKKNGGGGGSGVSETAEEKVEQEVKKKKATQKKAKKKKKVGKKIMSEFLRESQEKRLLDIVIPKIEEVIVITQKWASEKSIGNKGEVTKFIEDVKGIDRVFEKEGEVLRVLNRSTIRAHSYLEKFYKHLDKNNVQKDRLEILDKSILKYYNELVRKAKEARTGFENLLRGSGRSWSNLGELEIFPVNIGRVGAGSGDALSPSGFRVVVNTLSGVENLLKAANTSHLEIEKLLRAELIELKKA